MKIFRKNKLIPKLRQHTAVFTWNRFCGILTLSEKCEMGKKLQIQTF